MSEEENYSDNPFVDPSQPAEREGLLETDATLLVAHTSSLTLGADSLLVLDEGLVHRDASNCCGLLPGRSRATHAIPYYNILNAFVDELELVVQHALPTSKTSCRPARISYTLGDKTSSSAAKSWVAKLLDIAYPSGQRHLRLKVLVNPFGGKGAGRRIYLREIEPIFKAAGCELDVEQTTHVRHAVEIAEKIDVDKYDVIACASGDGLPHEVFNGLARQASPRRALKKIAVAQLPCGSGNAMSLNLNGTDSPALAALAVVKGVRTPLDLVAITQGDQQYWSFLSQSVGIVADCDLGTENIRWMGGARFTVGFLFRLLGKTVYPAEVAVKVEIDDKKEIKEVYRRTRSEQKAIAAKRESEIEEEMEDHLHSPLPKLQYGTVKDEIPDDWIQTSMPTLGNFYCGNMTWMSSDAPFFPAALPADNNLDLVNIDGNLARMTAVKALLAVEQNKFFDLPYVNYRKIKAYRISPKLRNGQTEGFISIDGEKVPFEPFQAEVVGGLGTVLSRHGGVYEFGGPRE
ncbi:hypothetical protein AAFC00_005417 [Neodothiora populina]|uniref:DAGKc domain-containing protein n=1 Tax=Neodothiora populina TaxID=2781224 RepID=A0ABR3PL62_9PEZI